MYTHILSTIYTKDMLFQLTKLYESVHSIQEILKIVNGEVRFANEAFKFVPNNCLVQKDTKNTVIRLTNMS